MTAYICKRLNVHVFLWLLVVHFKEMYKDSKDSVLTTNYTGAALLNSDNTYGSWSNIRHYYYTCSGSESSLSSCSNYYISSYYCVASNDDAGVRCASNSGMFLSIYFLININKGTSCAQNGNLRLTGGKNNNEGVLEYCYNGYWSPFCNLDDEEATVACKQLGYQPYASKIPVCVVTLIE